MFVKLTKSGPRRYLQLAESYRDENGALNNAPLPVLDGLKKSMRIFDLVIRGLRRATGRAPDDEQLSINFEPTRTLGDVWTLTEIWKELGFDRLASVFRSSKRQLDVEAMIRVMVFSRLCDSEYKLGVLRWLDTVSSPDIDTRGIACQYLIRSMDALMDLLLYQSRTALVTLFEAQKPT